jgi:F-type H+-transporting ATPase subunit delta
MREVSIARNYAEALLTLATKAGARDTWGATISALGDAVAGEAALRTVLEHPRVTMAQKAQLLRSALGGIAAPTFVRFVEKLVANRRQMLLPTIATEYHNLLDAAEGRVHARVTVAREADAAMREAIAATLSKALQKTVVPHLTVDPRIIGGVVVRVGDTVMDGSVQRRLSRLRDRLVSAR